MHLMGLEPTLVELDLVGDNDSSYILRCESFGVQLKLYFARSLFDLCDTH